MDWKRKPCTYCGKPILFFCSSTWVLASDGFSGNLLQMSIFLINAWGCRDECILKSLFIFLLRSATKWRGLTVPGNGFCHQAQPDEKKSIHRGSWCMTHAAWCLCKCGCKCLIQSLVPLWDWKCYKPASWLLTISINLNFPAGSHPSNARCNSPSLFNRNIQYILHRLQTLVGVCHI